MAATSSGLTIIPVRHQGFESCWVAPMLPHEAWVAHQRVPYAAAVLLECDPVRGDSIAAASKPDWPANAIRCASEIGTEPALVQGVPRVDSRILADPERQWNHLTLAFITPVDHTSLAEWASCRRALLETPVPERWPAPTGCETMLHVADRENLLLLSRQRSELLDWLARPVARTFDTHISFEDADQVARWALSHAADRGCRLDRIIRSGRELILAGTWGRGRDARQAAVPGEDPLEVHLRRA